MLKTRKGLQRKSSLRRTKFKRVFKPTGELELFTELYFLQSGKSALSGQDLLPPGHPLFHHQGSHLLPKGTYPDFRLDHRNVVMILPTEHDTWERIKNKEVLIAADPRWKNITDMYDSLKLEAYNKPYTIDSKEMNEEVGTITE